MGPTGRKEGRKQERSSRCCQEARCEKPPFPRALLPAFRSTATTTTRTESISLFFLPELESHFPCGRVMLMPRHGRHIPLQAIYPVRVRSIHPAHHHGSSRVSVRAELTRSHLISSAACCCVCAILRRPDKPSRQASRPLLFPAHVFLLSPFRMGTDGYEHTTTGVALTPTLLFHLSTHLQRRDLCRDRKCVWHHLQRSDA
jgi:hypothetical protein